MPQPSAVLQLAVEPDDAAVEGEDEGEGVVGDLRATVGGIVGDDNAEISRGVEIDVVEPDTVAAQHFDVGKPFQHLTRERFTGARQQHVGVGAGGDDLLHIFTRDGVQLDREIAVVSQELVLQGQVVDVVVVAIRRKHQLVRFDHPLPLPAACNTRAPSRPALPR